MSSEGFLVVLTILFFSVARPNEGLVLWHGMGVPLLLNWGEGWVVKENLVHLIIGGATMRKPGGSPILEKRRVNREFDATKGFPGEDGLPHVLPAHR